MSKNRLQTDKRMKFYLWIFWIQKKLFKVIKKCSSLWLTQLHWLEILNPSNFNATVHLLWLLPEWRLSKSPSSAPFVKMPWCTIAISFLCYRRLWSGNDASKLFFKRGLSNNWFYTLLTQHLSASLSLKLEHWNFIWILRFLISILQLAEISKLGKIEGEQAMSNSEGLMVCENSA